MVHRGAVTTVMGDSLGGGAGHGAGGVSPAANCPPTGGSWRGERWQQGRARQPRGGAGAAVGEGGSPAAGRGGRGRQRWGGSWQWEGM